MVVRVRQHVNPLARQYQTAIAPPDWSQIYTQLHHPLHLDIGCGRGKFLLEMAQAQPDWNFLGLEIRQPLVGEANRRRDELGLTNLHYLFCNANTSLPGLLDSLPPHCLQRVSIQFPDPWFKKRHQKRRVVQPELVEAISRALIPGGTVFLQSDVKAVAVDMTAQFAAHSAFRHAAQDPQHPPTPEDNWLATNPLPVPTEREVSTLARGEAIYRSLFIKPLTAP